MAGQVFEKIRSRNLCKIDVFSSRINIPDEESYDPVVTTAIMRLLPNISETDQRAVRLPFASACKGAVFEFLDSCRGAGLCLFFKLLSKL